MTGSRKYNFKCQSFPNTIEQERRRRGWTVTKLAELSGVSRYSIAAYETWAAGGIVPKQQMKSVTDTTAQMIADALEVTPEQLFKHYAEAAAEHKPRVKPFSTRAERDGAILKALEPAKYTALKMCGVLQCKDIWCEMDDVIIHFYCHFCSCDADWTPPRWSMTDRAKNVLWGVVHFETGSYTMVPAVLSDFFSYRDVRQACTDFHGYSKLRQIRLFKNGRMDIRFASSELAEQFIDIYLSAAYS